MKYLIVQDWKNTQGNHAGMVHMCKLLCGRYPEKYTMFVKDCPPPTRKRGKFLGHLLGWYDRKQYQKHYVDEYLKLCQPMFKNLIAGDEVFLLEYHWPATSQHELACYIRKNFLGVRIYGLTHLTPTWYRLQKGSVNMILEWEKALDKQLTLGSSLSHFFMELGIPSSQISTGFHYVDSDYYKALNIEKNERLTVITMGALQRDYSLLAEIVRGCSSVNWIICKGNKDVGDLFDDLPNVVLKGFLAEDELRHQMSISDISLNVLEDTVGSNVITTSMAMGLAIVVSDVGSIHDYCSDTNAIFCSNNAQSFINAICKLSQHQDKVYSMRKSSVLKTENFRIENVDKWFNSLAN